MLQQIDSLIFDFGGVLVDLNKQRTLEAFTAMGFDATPYIGHYVQSGIFEKLELGQLSAAAFYDEVRRASGNEHLTDAEIAAAWNSMLVGVPHERLDMLIELRRRYPVYLLSNTNAIHWDYACKNFFSYKGLTVNNFFEQQFISYQMNMMKPDPRIFETVIRLSEVVPERTLFIDDSEENCAAAHALGLRTFCPSHPSEWMPLFSK